MIRYTLQCKKGHDFDGWFQNRTAFDKQAKRKLVACPLCNSVKVEKAIMAPRPATSKQRKDEVSLPVPMPEAPAALPEASAPWAMISPH